MPPRTPPTEPPLPLPSPQTPAAAPPPPPPPRETATVGADRETGEAGEAPDSNLPPPPRGRAGVGAGATESASPHDRPEPPDPEPSPFDLDDEDEEPEAAAELRDLPLEDDLADPCPPPARRRTSDARHRDDRLYLVTYDISNQKRWRRVFKIMNGYGDWLQLSVFQCRLGSRRRAELQAALEDVIHRGQDHVLIIDIGPADAVKPKVTSLGKTFSAVERRPVII